ACSSQHGIVVARCVLLLSIKVDAGCLWISRCGSVVIHDHSARAQAFRNNPSKTCWESSRDVYLAQIRLATLQGAAEKPLDGRGRVIKLKKRRPFCAGAATSSKTVCRGSRGHYATRAEGDPINRDGCGGSRRGRRYGRARLANGAVDTSYIHQGSGSGGAGVVGMVGGRSMNVALVASANRNGN